MIDLTSLYLLVTLTLFVYTAQQQIEQSRGYFTAIMSYMSDMGQLFIVYNLVLCIFIILYKIIIKIFMERTLQGQTIKITDRLKMKIFDIIFFAYMMNLEFDFQIYLVVILVIFTFILHTHLTLRSQYLVHVYTTSTSLIMHYRILALYLVLFFFDFQVLKFIGGKMLSINHQREGFFLYYMFSTAALLADPFMQFIVDFYEKYTFTHFQKSDQFLALTGLIINIPRLIILVIISIWISYKFSQPFFIILTGIDNVSQLIKTIESFNKVRSLTKAMSFLKKVKGEELQQFHDLTCTVCYDDMTDGVMLPCRHIFHEECIRQWIIKNLNHFCPKCKRQFNFDHIKEEYNVNEQKKDNKEVVQVVDLQSFIQNKFDMKNMGQHRQEQNLEKSHNQNHRSERFQGPHFRQQRENVFNKQFISHEHQYQQQPFIKRDLPPSGFASNHEKSYSPFIKQQIRQTQQINYHKNRQNIRELQHPHNHPSTNRHFQHPSSQSRHYIVNRPQIEQQPLQVYQATKKKILAVGSLPYGLPVQAVANRTSSHMVMRSHYKKQIELALLLIGMNKNQQVLFI